MRLRRCLTALLLLLGAIVAGLPSPAAAGPPGSLVMDARLRYAVFPCAYLGDCTARIGGTLSGALAGNDVGKPWAAEFTGAAIDGEMNVLHASLIIGPLTNGNCDFENGFGPVTISGPATGRYNGNKEIVGIDVDATFGLYRAQVPEVGLDAMDVTVRLADGRSIDVEGDFGALGAGVWRLEGPEPEDCSDYDHPVATTASLRAVLAPVPPLP